MDSQLEQESLVSGIGERVNVAALLAPLVHQPHHLRHLLFIDQLRIRAMVFQELGDFSEGEGLALAVESGALGSGRLVSSVLVLREDVAPQFLVLAHELCDSLSIPILFFIELDVGHLLRFKCAEASLLYRFLPFLVGQCQPRLGLLRDAKLDLALLDLELDTLPAPGRQHP